MRILTFNTLEACDRLVEVGIPEEHAAAYVSVLADVACIDIDEIATRDYIDARLIKLEANLSERIAAESHLPKNRDGS